VARDGQRNGRGPAWRERWASPPGNWPRRATPAGFSNPQRERRGFRVAPHWPQHFISGGVSNPTARAARGFSSQEAHAVVGQRPLARQRHVAPADLPDIRDGVMGGATRPGRDHGRAGAGEAGDAVDACGLNGLGESHRRQDGGEPPGQPRLARPGWPQEEPIVVGTPGFASASHLASLRYINKLQESPKTLT
jgi:hypothetical protein